ncbi:methylmalonyl-CoA mutase subunit beta [Polymorphum gilvum]|uniref:Methylmalonyl-CoA mutase, small subunit n=1 Tax=Polymorphum gilvum (strain LMG 25793 / CGMCC 1.9160 / SL003B-26A1) TaxID=991905 RepID=F2IV74_POLGS|nr:methylmalonyl-CoA mutase subunit beta [Polymorphum gilvum]ADZ71405.1 Methylmalonyl-CoA mutase, small subunit [Polymorphum gilvum SL003B-26A1]
MTLDIPETFLASGEAAWHDAVKRALKGAPFDTLVGRTEDGLRVEPLYPRRADAAPQRGREAGRPWQILQRIDHPDPVVANELLLADLEGGADGFDLVLTSSANAHGHGFAGQDLASFARLFEGVLLDLVTVRVDGGYESSSALALLILHARQTGLDLSKLSVISCSDYVSKLVHTGILRNSVPMLRRRIADLEAYARGHGLSCRLLCADGRIWHDRGATHAQELAYVLATGLQYLRDLDAEGVAADDPARLISFTLVADADQTGSIAKVRAMRRLWASVLAASGLPQNPTHLHVETSWRMMTRTDPYVNMLRTTVACFAAGVGGADSVSVLPFTFANGLPDAFARRVARNTQAILIEESNLHRVADPSAGSGAIEARTDDLAEAAWTLFREVEAAGGIVEALRRGRVQPHLRAAAAERDRRIATRRQPITGVSAFPNLGEAAVRTLAAPAEGLSSGSAHVPLPQPGDGQLLTAIEAALAGGASITDIMVSRPPIDPMTADIPAPARLAEPYEALREAVAALPEAPVVFLAALGPLAQFTARATWAKNFFEAGGLRAVGGEPAADLDALVAAFSSSGATLVCLASSDRIYAEQAGEAARALSRAGARFLYLAGRPGDQEEAFRAAGIETFVFEGCDALDILRNAHRRLGIAAGADDASSAETRT